MGNSPVSYAVREKYAHFLAGQQEFAEALEIFESLAQHATGDSALKFSIDKHLLAGCLCVCGRKKWEDLRDKVESYVKDYPSFADSESHRWIQVRLSIRF